MTEPTRISIDGDRHYRIDGNDLPSVTTILGEYEPKQQALEGWKQNTDNWRQVRDRAALVGTVAHHRILNPYAIRSLPLPDVDMSLVDESVEADVETCEVLWDSLDFDVGDSPYIEEPVYSHEHGYAGTADMITTGPNNGAGTIVDLKTSSAIQDSHRMQVSAYRVACREMPSLPDPDHGAIIRLDPDPETNPEMTPEVELLRPGELDDLFDTFTDLLAKYNSRTR